MELTSKQEAYCRAIADGNTQIDAYRLSYKADTNDNSCGVNASKLSKNPKIVSRVAELRTMLAEKLLWSREDSVKTLKSVIDNADKNSDIISAVKELNSMHGYEASKKLELSGDQDKPIVVDVNLSPADAYKKMIGK